MAEKKPTPPQAEAGRCNCETSEPTIHDEWCSIFSRPTPPQADDSELRSFKVIDARLSPDYERGWNECIEHLVRERVTHKAANEALERAAKTADRMPEWVTDGNDYERGARATAQRIAAAIRALRSEGKG